MIYGDIADKEYWGDEVTLKNFTEALEGIGDAKELVVRINSGGGDVFTATAIYNKLKEHKAKITVKVDGWVASAATIIAMAGDTREIPENGVFMVHDPSTFMWGTVSAKDLEKTGNMLETAKQAIAQSYLDVTGKTIDEIYSIMTAETWYVGAEAVEAGFCDSVKEENVEHVQNGGRIITNSVNFDPKQYPNMPQKVLDVLTTPRVENSVPPQTEEEPEEEEEVEEQEEETKKTSSNKATQKGSVNMEPKTVEELKNSFPELTKQLVENATATERQRIKDIEEVTLEGFEDIAMSAKFEGGKTAADVAVETQKRIKAQGANWLSDRAQDVLTGQVGKEGATGEPKEGTPENEATALYNKMKKQKGL